MPDIPLHPRAIDFVTDRQVALRAWRAFGIARFVAQHGPRIRFETFLDPGAPFCVIPYSLWHGRHSDRPASRRCQIRPTTIASSLGERCDLRDEFLADNELQLVLQGSSGEVTGHLSVSDP